MDAGVATGAAAGCGVMACIGIGGEEGVGIWSTLDWQQILQILQMKGEGVDGIPDYSCWGSEGPVWVRGLQVIQLVPKNGGIKLGIVPCTQSLHWLVDCLIVTTVEEVGDFHGPVHGLDPDFDCFGFISNVTFRLDSDRVYGLYLHQCDDICGGTDYVCVDGPNRVHCPSVFRSCLSNLE